MHENPVGQGSPVTEQAPPTVVVSPVARLGMFTGHVPPVVVPVPRPVVPELDPAAAMVVAATVVAATVVAATVVAVPLLDVPVPLVPLVPPTGMQNPCASSVPEQHATELPIPANSLVRQADPELEPTPAVEPLAVPEALAPRLVPEELTVAALLELELAFEFELEAPVGLPEEAFPEAAVPEVLATAPMAWMPLVPEAPVTNPEALVEPDEDPAVLASTPEQAEPVRIVSASRARFMGYSSARRAL